MKAGVKNFGELIGDEKKFKIPFFQRAYVWSEEDWKKLFDDMAISFKNDQNNTNANKNTHFLGSIILKETDEDNVLSIIDGQQRLTTFSILLKILSDMLKEYKEDFNKYLFHKKQGKVTPRIEHSHINKDSYEKLFSNDFKKHLKEFEEQSKNKKDFKNDKILSCYIKMQEYIKESYKQDNFYNFEDNDKIYAFMDFLKDSKMWVVVNLGVNEDEQMIFDSINSTGQRLTATDIIKNALFDKIIKKCGENEANNMYEKYWKKIFEDNEETISFWNQEIVTGRIKRSKSEIFLHAFALINGFFDPEKNTLEQLSTKYKKDKIAKLDKNSAEEFLKSLEQYANIYRNFPNISKETYFEHNDYETRLFHILDVLDISTAMPLLMWLKKENCDLEKIYKLLEIFIISNWACSISTKDYNKFFAEIFRDFAKNSEVELLSYIKEKLIKYQNNRATKEKIKNKLKYIDKNKNRYAAFILFWIELFKQRDEKNDTNKLKYEYTLEHLMPQAWQKNWSDIVENEEKAEELIYQIGNMTLLKYKLNSSISNGKWNEKRSSIENHASLKINKELLNKNEWNEQTINERTNRFTSDFFKIWNLDELKNGEQDEYLPKKAKSQIEVFSFERVGIPAGATITYKYDKNKSAKVHDDLKQVVYEDKLYSLSGLAQKLYGSDYGLRGPKFFTYQGKLLSKI